MLCQCNLCRFINLEAMTKCHVIVTSAVISTVIETIGFQKADRTRTKHICSVSATLCSHDHLMRLVSEKVRRRAESHGKTCFSSAVLTSKTSNLLHILTRIGWSIFLSLSSIYLMALISSVFLESVANLFHPFFSLPYNFHKL